jgi:peptidoglycan/LPS O-acetylase OafA/YrhL
MSQRISRTDTKRRKRKSRLITFGLIAGISVLIIVLLYKERSDWLYVLATLSLTALLVIVALTDLHGGRQGVDEAALGDDSASIGSGITASPIATTAPSDWRGAKSRKTRRK